MNPLVAERLTVASEDFLRHVWPMFQPEFGALVPVESVTANQFATELDCRAGIDHWVLSPDGHMRGLAARVQWNEASYGTFTVRKRRPSGRPTEFDKRSQQLIDHGTISPHYACQGYITRDHSRLLAAALATTEEVIAAVTTGLGWEQVNPMDGTIFSVIPWDKLSNARIITGSKEGILF